ncbi:glycoside hydrolase [Mycena filopes]|nr:glycoside hydrolase [Mycena filopes]
MRPTNSLFAPRAKQDHLACFLAGSLMLGATRVHLQDPATAPLIDLEDSPLPVPVPVPVPAGQTAKDAGPVDVDLDVPLANSKAAQKPVVPVVPVVFDDDAVLVPAGQPNERRAAPPFPALANPLTGAQAAQIGKAVQGLRASVPPVLARELTAEGRRDWAVGVALLEGCMQTTKTLTGLAPESVWWRDEEQQPLPDEPGAKYDWFIMGANKFWPPWDARYILRPEISESVFLAYRLTGNPKYRKYAWDIFTAIERFCRLPEGGYASVLDVDHLPVKYEDKQETFFLSETLKYLYLTFADENVLDLNEVVFNTEAHPLPIFTPTIKPRFTEYAPLKPAPTGLY